MGLRDTAHEEGFFQERREPHSFKLKPYQQMQARLSAGAGGLGLPAAVVRRFSASLGNLTGTLPAVIAALRGPLGESVKAKMSETALVERMGDAIKEFHQERGLGGGAFSLLLLLCRLPAENRQANSNVEKGRETRNKMSSRKKCGFSLL